MNVPRPVLAPDELGGGQDDERRPGGEAQAVKTLGRAAGSATVRKTWRRDARALRATSR